MPKDTSFVLESAINCAINFVEKEQISRRLAYYKTDGIYGYPKGTMASYFGKLGAEKRKRKKSLFSGTHFTEAEIQADIDRCHSQKGV